MRSAALFGRASRLSDQGRKAEALALARESLSKLSQPHVISHNPAEASAVACTTVLLEGLAHELNQRGAPRCDVVDALKYIRANGANRELAVWVPYLEHRLMELTTSDG